MVKNGKQQNSYKRAKNPRHTLPADSRIAERIQLRRRELHLSQSDLGQALGVSFQQIQKYEKGVNRVGAARLEQIAVTLKCPLSFFYDKPDIARQEVESLLNLDGNFSLRMLRAYASIKDRQIAHQLVVLMEGIAG